MADIDVNYLSEAINDKMDRDAHNIQSPSAVVIAKQDPTEENGWTWYRLYSDGWVEQGGVLLNATTGSHQISVPIEMNNVNTLMYSTKVWFIFISGTIQNQGVHIDLSRQFSTTEFGCFSWGATGHIGWQVSGISKQN